MAHWCMEKKHAQFLATKKYLKNQDRMKNRYLWIPDFQTNSRVFLLCTFVRRRDLLICVYQLLGKRRWSTGHSKNEVPSQRCNVVKLWLSKCCAGQQWFPSSTPAKCPTVGHEMYAWRWDIRISPIVIHLPSVFYTSLWMHRPQTCLYTRICTAWIRRHAPDMQDIATMVKQWLWPRILLCFQHLCVDWC